MATKISAKQMSDSYELLNATDIKSYIINQLSSSNNPVFSGCSYLGSNMNALIDVLSVMTQQILFHFSVNAAEASFSTANLYESMNKLVSILNYKTIGKQTSMLPVRFQINLSQLDTSDTTSITIPRLTQVGYNSTYYLKNEIVIPLQQVQSEEVYVESVLFEGELNDSMIYEAMGDEFETFILVDDFIKSSSRFITDNFFIVEVFTSDGEWVEYQETLSLFSHDKNALVYERRFTEDLNYEFKFGNGINGKKLEKGDRIRIKYIISSGESAVLGDDVIQSAIPIIPNDTKKISSFIRVINTGNGTNISYPESVDSIRANAPKIFSSQNRLFTLADYKTFIMKNYSNLLKDSYFCTNDEYTKDFLKYYYDLGLDSPQQDSRINIAQVEFMTSTNFNNIYCFAVPKSNTVISWKVPNYVNNMLKQEIVNGVQEYKGLTHNLVILDPIYRAMTFGSFMDDSDFNVNQLNNKLVLVRDRLSKYNHSFIKDYVVELLTDYFGNLQLGEEINLAQITKDLNSVPGVKRFFIRNENGDEEKKFTLYTWNPLYSNEDNEITQQNILIPPFVYPYFYDLTNISKLIVIEDE